MESGKKCGTSTVQCFNELVINNDIFKMKNEKEVKKWSCHYSALSLAASKSRLFITST